MVLLLYENKNFGGGFLVASVNVVEIAGLFEWPLIMRPRWEFVAPPRWQLGP